jgi:hypothetical protein
VYVEKPKVHETALLRIKNNAHIYVPIGIPHDYEVISPEPPDQNGIVHFKIDSLPATATAHQEVRPKPPGQAQARVNQERTLIWPLVYIRAALYFLTLVATAFFVIFPFAGRSDPLARGRASLPGSPT